MISNPFPVWGMEAGRDRIPSKTYTPTHCVNCARYRAGCCRYLRYERRTKHGRDYWAIHDCRGKFKKETESK